MDLPDILAEESVLYCAGVTTKPDVLKELCKHAAARTGVPFEIIAEAVSNRESLGSTGLGNGIAIPHGKIAGLDHVTAVFARLETPVDFDSVDDQPVDIVVLLLAPLGAGADHLKALALVARILRSESTAERLRAQRDPARIFELLAKPLATHKAA